MENYHRNCIPSYARRLKDIHKSKIVTSFLDSPSHENLLLTVPFDQRPPVFVAIYADAIDRDQMLHSSARNKLHCTYLKVLNVAEFGLRSRDDYELYMVLNEATIKRKGYQACHEALVANLSKVIASGISIDGKNHAVRLAYIQVIFTS